MKNGCYSVAMLPDGRAVIAFGHPATTAGSRRVCNTNVRVVSSVGVANYWLDVNARKYRLVREVHSAVALWYQLLSLIPPQRHGEFTDLDELADQAGGYVEALVELTQVAYMAPPNDELPFEHPDYKDIDPGDAHGAKEIFQQLKSELERTVTSSLEVRAGEAGAG